MGNGYLAIEELFCNISGDITAEWGIKQYWGRSKMTLLGEGGEGYPKLVTKSDIGGRGLHANSDFTT